MNTPNSPLAPSTFQASASAPKSFTVGGSAATGNNLLLSDDQTGGTITITSATTASTELHLQEPVEGRDPANIILGAMRLTSTAGSDQVHGLAAIDMPPKGTHERVPAGLQITKEFPQDVLSAAKEYTKQRIVVFPLVPPKPGDKAQNGKKPAIKGYKDLKLGWLQDKDFNKYWGGRNPHNIGALVPPGKLVVDLDSKADHGKTAREFIAKHPQLQNALRVHTQGGVHLWLECPDIPILTKADGKPLGAPLAKAISDSLNAELMLPGMQITLPPSRRETGHVYQWLDAGEVLTLHWAEVVKIFGFTHEKSEPQTYHQRLKELQNRHHGDIATLNVVALFKQIGKYGCKLESGPTKHAVACPFSAEHSSGEDSSVAQNSSTVVFEAGSNTPPGFNCLHAHCRERNLLDVIEWVDKHHPGKIDECCVKGWRPQIALPGEGRSASDFASETALVLAKARKYFRYGTEITAVRPLPGNSGRLKLSDLGFREAITDFETEVSFGNWRKDDKDNQVFTVRSMAVDTAQTLLASSNLRDVLPEVRRLLEYPLPLLDEKGRLVIPKAGYDPHHQTFLQPSAPAVEPMDLEDAKKFLREEFLGNYESGGFPWRDEQSQINAMARLLTPLCRGLMGWAKAPLFILLANQPRLGKDTFAKAVLILYTGEAGIGAPLDDKSGDAEMRKRITALLRNGRLFIHFANMSGHVAFGALEAATDASLNWTDRILGHSREATLPNEAEYSLSMNMGATLTRDLMARSVVIELHLALEDPNRRHFKHDNLEEWVKSHRGRILGALLALIYEWDRLGRPHGSVRFASFPQWSQIVGGIMEANGLGNPCVRQDHLGEEIGDPETNDMRHLFVLANEQFGNAFVTKSTLYHLISETGDDAPFSHFKLNGDQGSKADQTKFGKILDRFKDRELGGITLKIDASDKNRKKLAFVRKGGSGKAPSSSSPSPYIAQTMQTSQTAPTDHEAVNPSLQPSEGGNYEQASAPYARETSLITSTQVCNVCEVPAETPIYKVLTDEEDTEKLLSLLNTADLQVGLDLETFGKKPDDALNPQRGSVRLIQLAIGDQIFLLDVLQTPTVATVILKALKQCRLVGHNLAFDLAFLKRHYGFEAGSVFCTMTASRVLHAGEDVPHDLGAVLQRNLGLKLTKEHGSSDWSGNLTQDQLDYAAADVAHLADLGTLLQRELDAAGLTKTAELEMECVLLAVVMQSNGIHVDSEGLKSIQTNAEADLATAQTQVNQLAGDIININSAAQIVKCLRARGLTVENSQEETLRGLKDELADQIVTAKAANTMIKKCNELLGAIEMDGRIHASFNPMQAKTGRFSTSKPNLQSIPRGQMRACFRARPGFMLVDADYSQIELRIAAAVTGEEKMLKAFTDGKDLHVQTAALVLNKPETEVTSEERQMAKAVNFGLLYGQKPAGLVKYAASSYGVTMTEGEATKISLAFFTAYPALANWQKAQSRAASNAEVVRTAAFDRRRVLKQGIEEWWSRYTALLNSPIQGGAADGMKMALCRLNLELPKDCLIVNTVHDEILIECPEDAADQVRQLVEKTMVEEMQRLFPDVPIVAEAKVIQSWHDK